MTKEDIINLANRCSRKIWEICMEEPGFSTNDYPEGANGLSDIVLNVILKAFPATKECSSFPSDSDEAAKEFAKTTFKKPYSDNPDEEVTIVEPDKYAGFIAGARHEDEQLSEKIAAAYQLGLADKEKQMMSMAVEGWVAVDSDTYCKRRVTFFPQKPVRDVLTEYKYWAATRPRYESIELDSNAFPSLKWEDEPKKVKLIIIKED